MRRPPRPALPAPAQDEDALRRLRLTVKIALMYHQRGMSQAQVAKHLGLSQARVSQLLKAAVEQQIVETVVHVPPGMFSHLEDDLERGYDLESVTVVDAGPSAGDLKRALGAGAAPFVQAALEGAKVIGVAAWSETLLAAVEAMQPILPEKGRYVVNVFGGFGPSVSAGYTRLMERLASLCSARPVFLLGPGVVANARLRNALRREPQVQDVVSYYDRLSVLLVGIGALPTATVLSQTGYVSEEDQAELLARGAVGDISLHFFDAAGRPVRSSLDDRVVGIELEQLRKIPRILAIAGGPGKLDAIHAAIKGRWIHSLITDLDTAQALAQRL